MYRIFQKFYNGFWDLLFPRRCLSCGKEGASFCSACRGKIPLRGGFSHEGIFSLWEYGHPDVRNAITSLKYKNKRPVAKDIADSLSDALLEHLADKSVFSNPVSPPLYLLIPIPLSKERFKKREYNQAELLAKELSLKNPTSFVLDTASLQKTRDTGAQVTVGEREKRLRNMRGAFTVTNAESIRGRTILLIDDVTTTGATLAEARRALLKAGARLVYGITVAH